MWQEKFKQLSEWLLQGGAIFSSSACITVALLSALQASLPQSFQEIDPGHTLYEAAGIYAMLASRKQGSTT